jgi:hypothetical protein|tara:strand:+ start:239 stop:700 length:462 start_codon:yes stop_codon:yes gene_type:complete
MKNYILNAELITNNKFTASEILDIKLLMESREDFIILYNIFIDCIESNFNGFLEIYVEDVELDTDLQNDLEKVVNDLDSIIPGGLSNDSKIEWTAGTPAINTVWYKDNGDWFERISESEREFLSDAEFEDDDYDNSLGGYNEYSNGQEGEDFW